LFPPPWRIVRDRRSSHYRIMDARDHCLAWVYVGRHNEQFKMLNSLEAEAMAKAIARLSLPKE